MDIKLRPYPQYNDSSLPWLDTLPVGWDFQRAKNVFRTIDIRSKTGQEELLSVSSTHGVIPRRDVTVTMFKAESYVGYKLCWPRDLIINSLWAWMQGLGFSRYHGIVSTAYGVYRLKEDYLDTFKYFDYLLRSCAYLWELRIRSKGIWRSRLQLTDDSFFNIPILLPPSDERKQIVHFLDSQTNKINNLIRKKRKLIELLNEQKQVIINQAVTQGINPNVRFKPSNVDYLGDIPKHWMIKPLKHWVKINMRVLPESTDPNYELLYLDISAVSTGFLVKEPERMLFANSPSRARRILSKGDTIISTVRTYLKAIYFIEEDLPNYIASTGFAVLTPNKEIYPKFLSYVIQSKPFIDRVTANSIGVAYPAIAETKLGAFHLAIPSDFIEQQAIVKQIEKEIFPLERAINKTLREIDLIHEYRTRLIYDVVTGKIDVRDIPVEPSEEPEGYEELDMAEETEIQEKIEELEEVQDEDV